MNDVIVIENYVDRQCIRHIHVMSNYLVPDASLVWGEGTVTLEGGAYHFRSVRPHYGVLDIACVNNEKRFRRLVVWSFAGCTSVTQALREAKTEFCRLFGSSPQFAFVLKMPVGAEHGMEIEGMTLSEAEWMLEKCVAVGGKQ